MTTTSKLFCESIKNEFDGFLAKFGFVRMKCDADDFGFSVTYRKGEQYMNIGGTMHQHDYPYYSWLKLGYGSDEFPESDWNSTALWRIVQEISPEDHAKAKDLYEIKPNQSSDEVSNKVRAIQASFNKHGTAFLDGNLDVFRRVRAAQNKRREPYKIYTPSKQGGYKMNIDEASSRLKEKFS